MMCSLDVCAEIKTGEVLAFDFSDKESGSEGLEHFAGFGAGADGDDVIAFIDEEVFEHVTGGSVGVNSEDEGLLGGGGGGIRKARLVVVEFAAAGIDKIFAGSDAESDSNGVMVIGGFEDANDAALLFGLREAGCFAIGEGNGDFHVAEEIGIRGEEEEAVARDVDGGGDDVGSTAGKIAAADADRRRDEGAASSTAFDGDRCRWTRVGLRLVCTT